MPKISIIIPVYNVDQYLRQCLDSVVNQTLKDIEIICIDDGSTDNSGKILDEYASSDSRIKVIHQENKGVGAARNVGIEKSIAKYLMFLDGDDYFLPKACEKALNCIETNCADICIFGNFDLKNKDLCEGWTSIKINEFLKSGIYDYSEFQIYVWDKIFRKNFLQVNNIKFAQTLKTAEDVVFLISCKFKAPIYKILNENLYVHRLDRLNSATNSTDSIYNDLKALETLYHMPEYVSQNLSLQLDIVKRFCSAALGYLHKFKEEKNYSRVIQDAEHFIKFIENKFPKYELRKIVEYKKLKHYRMKHYIRQIFSICNSADGENKVFTILNFRIVMKRVA